MMRVIFISIFFILFSNILICQQNNEEYIENYKGIAILKMKKYGIPASITLAQGIIESAAGTSKLAVNANNHFGIKCHGVWTGEKYYADDDEKDECFRKYNKPEESFNDHSEFLKTRDRYAKLFELKPTDYKGWAYGLKNAGYATNPKYPQLLIDLIEKYNLERFDKMSESDAIAFNNHNRNNTKHSAKDREIFINDIKNKRKTLYNNKTAYIIAEKGDTPEKIAKEFDMMVWQIIKYNDMQKDEKIRQGETVYIKPKRNKGEKEYHIVANGETMRMISQTYGVKMKKLYKKNNLEFGQPLKAGTKIFLRKKQK
ncbi:MAG: hypothetical protein A2X12_05685 [Bacteroidetes bacterium GWE2_29_8]|nr:MAG: hypothetical protein A2X12_05685 [Bacteroidetes bacterium GWE2_29_8]OFY23752.1 MAG: hypothetical protein A2X02_03525 [Bacteroidetes bacterium GWF2_29_10]